MKSLVIPAGQRTVIWTRRFSSMPSNCRLAIEPVEDGRMVSGTLEVTASLWIFPGTPETVPLLPLHTLYAGMWNTFYTVAITPEVPVKVTRLDGRLNGSPALIRKVFLFALLIAIIALAAAVYWLGGAR